MGKDDKFTYKYVALSEDERREVTRIKHKYDTPDIESAGLSRLRFLNDRVQNVSNVSALVVGVMGTLIFGTGLACVIEWNMFILGIILSIVGCVISALAYPVFKHVYDFMKNKHRAEILEISEKLLSEDKPDSY